MNLRRKLNIEKRRKNSANVKNKASLKENKMSSYLQKSNEDDIKQMMENFQERSKNGVEQTVKMKK